MPFNDAQRNRSVDILRAEDDAFGQAGVLVRAVFNDDQSSKRVEQVAVSLMGGVHGVVLDRAFEYWNRIDAEPGKRIEAGCWSVMARPRDACLHSLADPVSSTRLPALSV